MKAIILSAGQGKRLLPHTADCPKCALTLGDRSALEWQLESLAHAGASEVVIVTGFKASMVDEVVRGFDKIPVRTYFNPFYAHSDNLGTCWVARHEMTDPFVIINGDTMFEPEIFRRLVDADADYPIKLVTNEKASYDDDDMKVIVDDGKLMRVDKRLDVNGVDGESIGMIRFKGEGVALFRNTVEALMAQESTLRLWYLSAVDQLARLGHVGTVDTGGHRWCEIDDQHDLEFAQVAVPGWWKGDRQAAVART